ncbi:zinc-binding dehydrogenase [Streptomyces sp. NBC_00647]|uniref:zinc-binding dehydrogenase n=1 Tax=Streptomyces sp. NBC_00647 TaxID=2975796 RepID=UPI0032451FDC
MKGFVFHGPGQSAWDDVPDPAIKEPTDAIVRVGTVTICGTDSHILKGDVPEVRPGRVLGHEAVGEIVEVGSDVRTVRPGDTVAVVGAGPIGLAAIAAARLFAPERIVAVDVAASRPAVARRLGADAVADARDEPEQLIADLTDGLGADVVIEAVGVPESVELCTRMVRPGGHVANVGVHGKPATLHLEDLWIKNVTITTGLVDTHSTPTLPRMATAGRLPAAQPVTHTFPLDRMEEACDVFAHAADTGALKEVLGEPSHEEVAISTTDERT